MGRRIQPRRAFSTRGLEQLALVGTLPDCFRETDRRSQRDTPAASFLAPRQRAIARRCILLGSKSRKLWLLRELIVWREECASSSGKCDVTNHSSC
jgi:hypothetical protein